MHPAVIIVLVVLGVILGAGSYFLWVQVKHASEVDEERDLPPRR